MHETERLSALIGDIYDAALQPWLWANVLENAARFIGGPAASVFSKDVTRSVQIFYQYGIDPGYVRLYVDKYIKLDPSTNSQLFASVGDIISTKNFIAYDEFLETRFYKEWAQPQLLVDSANAVLEKSATDVAMFTVFRHKRDGLVNSEMRRRMQLLIPHVRRAVLVGRLLDRRKSDAAAFADTFDRLSAGMFLVEATGHIVHSNAAGCVLLSAGELLYAAGSRLVAGEPKIDELLQDAFMAASRGDGVIGAKGIALPLTSRGGESYVAHVLPLTSGARRRAGTSYAAVAVLFVHKAALDAPSPLEAIAKAYKLTPTELRVLLAIVEVGGVPEVAGALGIAASTVKTHLSRLYGKTHTSRQADLVKLVAGFSSPLIK
jgi:DNA-binding CsgD family transcriptional regulator